jgi:hypothetical protein
MSDYQSTLFELFAVSGGVHVPTGLLTFGEHKSRTALQVPKWRILLSFVVGAGFGEVDCAIFFLLSFGDVWL